VNRALTKTLTCFVTWTLAALAWSPVAISDDSSPTPAAARRVPAELAKRVLEITDAVLEHHIDPPARQQMVLSGIKALYHKAGLPVPQRLSRRISDLATAEQLEAFLAGVYPKSVGGAASAKALEESLIDGLLQSVPGDARMISAKDRKVEEQFAGNRYVGLHIALTTDEHEKRPMLADVLEGGPADRAGVKKGDLIEQIDGVDTKGMPLREAVDRLRGDEGTNVTIKVRQPKARELRTYKITRGQLPRMTVRGVRKRSAGGWDVRLDGPDPIGYLQITEISASTPHELRKLASQLESDGARALVLDLRGLRTDNLHSTVVVADTLLNHGCIGQIRTSHGETKYQADSDALFEAWPLAVLIDETTAEGAEWLAAALQDNHRAVLVGMPSYSAKGVPGAGVQSTISVGDGAWSIVLTTGRLERGDGRPLAVEAIGSRGSNMNPFAAAADADAVARVLKHRLAARAGATKESTPKAENSANTPVVPEADSKYGVKPDHTAGGAPTMLTRARLQRKDQDRSSEVDEALPKAVAVLREALKKN
jgi:carboxyl-terminal processing protease